MFHPLSVRWAQEALNKIPLKDRLEIESHFRNLAWKVEEVDGKENFLFDIEGLAAFYVYFEDKLDNIKEAYDMEGPPFDLLFPYED